MRPPLPRLRLLALLLALLPGLLLCEGERLTVCLHALIGVGDACVAADAGSGLPDCCGQDLEGPRASSQGGCGSCCIELAAQATAQPTPAPTQVSGLALALCLPPRSQPSAWAPAVAANPRLPATRPAACAPGRAPTPLRI